MKLKVSRGFTLKYPLENGNKNAEICRGKAGIRAKYEIKYCAFVGLIELNYMQGNEQHKKILLIFIHGLFKDALHISHHVTSNIGITSK
jgi:hypothetical protein